MLGLEADHHATLDFCHTLDLQWPPVEAVPRQEALMLLLTQSSLTGLLIGGFRVPLYGSQNSTP